MPLLVKICGLSDPATLDAALEAGADWIGLVFFPKSPRNVSFDTARALAGQARGAAQVVALTVDPDDAALDRIVEAVSPDRIQLHGAEAPERVAAVRRRVSLPTIKAVGVEGCGDLARADAYRGIADDILFDAKPPRNAALPGGNGATFDWTLLGVAVRPFILSGGLTPETVGSAVRVTRPAGVDVSSGVESAPGVKDPGRIRAFVAAARTAFG